MTVRSDMAHIIWAQSLSITALAEAFMPLFVLSLSYLQTQSNKSFSEAELNKKCWLKSDIKAPASTVIDIIKDDL
jgi:hypothetical protein